MYAIQTLREAGFDNIKVDSKGYKKFMKLTIFHE